MLLSLTTEWVNLDEIIEENSGFFVNGGDSVEYLITSTIPISSDKGSMIIRGFFCNIFKGYSTYVRAPLPFGTSSIIIEPSYFNYKSRKIQATYLGFKWIIDLESMELSVYRVGQPDSTNMATLMSIAVSYLQDYGYSLVGGGVRSPSLFNVTNSAFSGFEDTVLVVYSSEGNFNLYRSRDMVQMDSSFILNAGSVVLEIQKI